MNKQSNKVIDWIEKFKESQPKKKLSYNNNKFIKKEGMIVIKKKEGIGLYKTFKIYNEDLQNLIKNYKNLKNSLKNFNIIKKYIYKGFYIDYRFKNLYGTINYLFKGKLRIDEFFFYFNKFKNDKKLFNIFRLNNLILKEALSKLNRHGLAFKYIYDTIYRKILKFPYLITIKPKTIIILYYYNFNKFIIEWRYDKNLEKVNAENIDDYLNIKKWIRLSLPKKYNIILDKINFFNYYIYNYYLNLKKRYVNNVNLLLNKNYKIFLTIKNIYMIWEFNFLLNVKKIEIKLDTFWNFIAYDYIEEECEELYSNYLKEIKENINFINIKENLFKLILKKKIIKNLYIKNFYKNRILDEEENNFLFIDLIKYSIININKNIEKEGKNLFFDKENYIKKHKNNFKMKYNFLYKLYFLYFFWSIFYLNKIFFYLNKIFFNLWNRFYYFFNNSYNLKTNKLMFSYSILYKNINIFNNIEYENKWKNYVNYIKNNLLFYKDKMDVNYKIWKNNYYYLFMLNSDNIKNKVYEIYNKSLSNLNIYKIYNKNIYKYEKIYKSFHIIDNLSENNYNYNIYYNYNYFLIWKIDSILNFDLIKKPKLNKLLIDYKKINNLIENIFYNDKILMDTNLIDSKIKNDIYFENKLNRPKKKYDINKNEKI